MHSTASEDQLDIHERLSLLGKHFKQSFQDPSLTRANQLFRIGLLFRENGILVDLGGGIAIHNGILAELGMAVYVVDLLRYYWENRTAGATAITEEVKALENCGVKFIEVEVSKCDLTTYFADNSVDVVTSFHCLEHLHQSPKFVLESAMRVLKPGGKLLIEVPNAANARKRLALLFGRTNYYAYNLYYYSSNYLGHVREYTVGDLRQLAKNLGAVTYRVFGKNTIYGGWVMRLPSPIRKALDLVLQAFPGLCSALLLEITKA